MIKISRAELREFLTMKLERVPSKRELLEFEDFVLIDIPDWLRDNWKAWISLGHQIE